MVSVAEFFQDAANSCEDIPAILAKVCKPSPPFATAASIVEMVVEKAVPPASASTPREDMAPAHPRISAWLILVCVPAAAMRCPMEETCDSVVARLFPKATIDEP